MNTQETRRDGSPIIPRDRIQERLHEEIKRRYVSRGGPLIVSESAKRLANAWIALNAADKMAEIVEQMARERYECAELAEQWKRHAEDLQAVVKSQSECP
jgi:hypothetical protein